MGKLRAMALIDGEHYIPVLKGALNYVRENYPEYELVAAVFLGGTEKIGTPEDVKKALDIPVVIGKQVPPIKEIVETAKKYNIDVAIDMSDEPVVDYEKRFMIASALMAIGVRYVGADFEFKPIDFQDVAEHPSLKCIGLGKRVGKTAISMYTAYILKQMGRKPCVVKAARGGPEKPTALFGDRLKLTPEFLLSEADKGKHAASDYYEEALMAGIIAVGARRCGGGMVGKPFYSTEVEAVKYANTLPVDFIIVEGSGTTVPAVYTDATELVVSALTPPEHISSFFGPYRVKISELIVITMAEEYNKDKVEKLRELIKELNPEAMVSEVVLRPKPLGDIKGKKIVYASVAPEEALEKAIIPYIEEKYGAEVVGYTRWLSNRPKLRKDLEELLPKADVLVTELKAAAVDVATRMALSMGKEVVYVWNIPVTVGGIDVEEGIKEITRRAIERFEKRKKK
ncbi:MAG TPA: 2,3-diphosphoglycerate synthetase [Desulfurococcaceae archaeon]|nr:2,3-diphosphoglycerate synthetase [Desulfurococcaceae archaeon]